MQNTTVEIIERIGNATHQLAGSLVEHGNNSTTTAFALRHTTSIDDDLAELGRRLSELEQTYNALSKLIGNLEAEAMEGQADSRRLDALSATSPFRAYWKTYPPEGGVYATRLLVIEVTYGNGEVRKVSCTSDEASELATVLASERGTTPEVKRG